MEIWKDVIGFENRYQVSNLGNVKGLNREYLLKGKYLALRKEKILKPDKDWSGYLKVRLYGFNISRKRLIHQLVAESFLNHTPKKGIVVNHKNFIKTDNRVENLEIVTHRENSNKKHLKSSSQYTGVSWSKKSNKWKSQISINRKIKHIGYYKDEHDAHLAYQEVLKTIK